MNFKKLQMSYSYDDVTLVPAYSELQSRSETNPTMLNYDLPIIGSCMDTLGKDIKDCLINKNIPFIAHRAFKSAKEQLEYFIPENKFIAPFDRYQNIWWAVGSVQKYESWIEYLYDMGVRNFCIDMAHGDSKACVDTIKYIKNLDICKKEEASDRMSVCLTSFGKADRPVHIIAGNVATKEGFNRLQRAGADGIRVGIASGSICFTPNTKVWYVSNSGKVYQKEIRFIEVGDKVLTASGHARKVLNKFVNPYIGEIYKINDILATPTHKFHVFNNETREKIFLPIKDIDPKIHSFITHSFIKGEDKIQNIDIDLEEYAGNVYNIEVDDEHTYLVGSKMLGVSNCSTNIETGMGLPILTSIIDCAKVKYKNTWLIADGGIRSAGDIAKAIYFGADFCMIGKLLAATDLACGTAYNKDLEEISPENIIYPEDYKVKTAERIANSVKSTNQEYYNATYIQDIYNKAEKDVVMYKGYHGMASRSARNNILSYAGVEGAEGLLRYTGKTEQFLLDTKLRLQSALSYGGAKNWQQFRKTVKAYLRTPGANNAAGIHLDVITKLH